MMGTTNEAIRKAAEEFMQAVNEALNADDQADSERKVRHSELEVFVDSIQMAEQIPRFIEAAEASGLPVLTWIIDRLGDAADPNTANLPIRREVYDRFVSLAQMRNMPLDMLCRGDLMTQVLKSSLDNGRI